MAVTFLDSFDHYVNPSQKWDVVESSQGTPTILANVGRNGTQALRFVTNHPASQRCSVNKNFGAVGVGFVGFAMSLVAGVGTDTILVEFLDGVSTQIDLRVTPGGKFYFTRGGAQIGLQSANAYPFNAYHFVEVMVNINPGPSLGVAELRVDGTVWLTVTANTSTTGSTQYTSQKVGNSAVTANQTPAIPTIDDLYMSDATGILNVTYLGDVRVLCLLPIGNGDVIQLTPVPGTINYQMVNEAIPDGDATYVTTSVAGTEDLYVYAVLPFATGQIKAVQGFAFVEKMGDDIRSLYNTFKVNGVVVGGAALAIPNSYAFLTSIEEADPSTGQLWTISNFNILESGPEAGEIVLSVVVADVMTISDSYSQQMVFLWDTRVYIESFVMSDSLSMAYLFLQLSDTMTMVDFYAMQFQQEQLFDSLAMSDSIRIGFGLIIPEQLVMLDGMSTVFLFKQITDAIAVSDLFKLIYGMNEIKSESINNLAESVSAVLH